jgi:allophanate hydrolase subunit 2
VAHTPQNSHLIGRKRPPFDTLFDTPQSIRFFWGIHSDVLKNKAHFAKEKWQLDEASSLMGIRLKGAMLEATTHDIASSSVSDGTIQLTKNGPIVLMRHRQTTGGYAQIAHIYEVDINTLAQIALGQSIYLKEGTLSDAKSALKAEEKALTAWQNSLTP